MRSRIEAIRNHVLLGGAFAENGECFAGAGLIVSPEPIGAIEGKLIVVTEHALALSGLIAELRAACSDWLNFENKYDFFPALGRAAAQYLSGASDLEGLLLHVIEAAFKMEGIYNASLYFAYGSNMDEAQMARRCPDARLLDVVRVPGYRFALDEAGVATLLPDESSAVEGLLWAMEPSDIQNLDRYEGVARGCYRKEYLSMDAFAPGHSALVYFSNRRLSPRGERPGYMAKIVQAARDHQLSAEYLQALTNFLPDAERA